MSALSGHSDPKDRPGRSGQIATALAACLSAALAIQPVRAEIAPPPGQPDLQSGQDINEVCAGCHGDFGQGGKNGEYPRIAGLPMGYIYRQIKLFQKNVRPNMPMLEHVQERQLKDDEIRDIAAYIAAISLPTRLEPMDEKDPRFDAFERMAALKRVMQIPIAPGDVQNGRKLYGKDCRSCHGADGWGNAKKQVPQLAGQYTSYLWRQIGKLIDGARVHDPDDPDEEILKDFTRQELRDILAYLSTVDD